MGVVQNLVAGSRDEAWAVIRGLVQECVEGKSDRELEALHLAREWSIDLNEVITLFKDAKETAKRPKVVKRRPLLITQNIIRRLPGDDPKPKPKPSKNIEINVGPPNTQVASSVSGQPQLAEKPIEGETLGIEAIAAKNEVVLAGGGLPDAKGVLGFVSLWPALLEAFNKRYAVIGNVGGKCRVLEWIPSELDEGALVPSFQAKGDFINRYSNRPIGLKKKNGEPITWGEWWFNSPQRADYRGVVFKPGKPFVISSPEIGSWMNLWRGWGIQPAKGRWPLMRKHIEEILSGGEQTMADYALRWTAWGFQNPGDLTESALTFRGRKGAGKGIFFKWVRMIYGPHGLQIFHATHLTGQFNAHLWTCLLLFVDEAFWAGDKQGESVLKGLITERPSVKTPKGVDSSMAVNRVKIGIVGNSDWLVPASHDERRYAVSDVDNRWAKGVAAEKDRNAYFGPIDKEMAEGGAAAMLYDLLQMDLGNWHPREVPMTKGLMQQKKQSLRGHWQWLEPLLQSGVLPDNCEQPCRILTEDLVSYVRTFRGQEYATDESIAGFLYNDIGLSSELWPKGNRFRVGGGGPRGWHLPQPPELRKKWEALMGGEWDWHEPIDCWSPCQSALERKLGSIRRVK
jgi:hypothetical protein